jgi:drug/metabolite transporter (DMT)-like permease
MGIFFAVLAAALYALSTPFSKLLLTRLSPTLLAAFLYLGAGAGMLVTGLLQRRFGPPDTERRLDRSDLPDTAAMVALDIVAPILLLLGLTMTTAANAALLNNFEIAATAVIALALFGEAVSRRLWLGIALVTLASVLLCVEDAGSLSFSGGSLLVALACVCWGFENNCTRRLSKKDPLEIVVVKGFGSGTGSLIVGLALGHRLPPARYLALALALGYVAYGLSIFFYIRAQRALGAARTSAFYAAAPFIGAALSCAVLGERPGRLYFAALAVMAAGAYFASTEGKHRRAGS